MNKNFVLRAALCVAALICVSVVLEGQANAKLFGGRHRGGGDGCGCAAEVSCGCAAEEPSCAAPEPSCGCAAVEESCGCAAEPSCGCSSGRGRHRLFGGHRHRGGGCGCEASCGAPAECGCGAPAEAAPAGGATPPAPEAPAT